jgi:hypothetical protein
MPAAVPGVVLLFLSFWLLFLIVGTLLILLAPSLRFLATFLVLGSTLLVLGAFSGGWLATTLVNAAMRLGKNWNPLFFNVMRLLGVLAGAGMGLRWGLRLSRRVNRKLGWRGALV